MAWTLSPASALVLSENAMTASLNWLNAVRAAPRSAAPASASAAFTIGAPGSPIDLAVVAIATASAFTPSVLSSLSDA